MKPLIILLVLAIAIYQYTTWQPSAISISRDMQVTQDALDIKFNDESYSSTWNEVSSTTGFLRRLDREYYDHAPIITYHLVVTTGDYSDRELVKIDNKGNGKYTYLYRNDITLTGGLTIYHVIPANTKVQEALKNTDGATNITFDGRISTDSILTKNKVPVFRVNGTNHKILLLENLR